MTTRRETAGEISGFLRALPGVRMRRHRVKGRRARFAITISDAGAARQVQRLCDGANVAFEPPLRLRDLEEWLEGPRRFTITAQAASFDVFKFGYLQLLGIHIVWRLHRIGGLPADVANRRLRRWHAALVGDPNWHPDGGNKRPSD